MLNENLNIDINTGIYVSERSYSYSLNQVNYIGFAWELSIFWDGASVTCDPEEDAVGQYLYAQKKGAEQDIQLFKDFGFKMQKI